MTSLLTILSNRVVEKVKRGDRRKSIKLHRQWKGRMDGGGQEGGAVLAKEESCCWDSSRLLLDSSTVTGTSQREGQLQWPELPGHLAASPATHVGVTLPWIMVIWGLRRGIEELKIL
uniref:Uncharacterized protein n=1 Tax=Molossus molossus TaxID=27622 RepID=A0A7J8GQU9_MOLMO|nr:hypothetical protein HJG59_011372 [Molossus molossus]